MVSSDTALSFVFHRLGSCFFFSCPTSTPMLVSFLRDDFNITAGMTPLTVGSSIALCTRCCVRGVYYCNPSAGFTSKCVVKVGPLSLTKEAQGPQIHKTSLRLLVVYLESSKPNLLLRYRVGSACSHPNLPTHSQLPPLDTIMVRHTHTYALALDGRSFTRTPTPIRFFLFFACCPLALLRGIVCSCRSRHGMTSHDMA